MAQPLRYQSQFIPTDFNQVGNLLGMFRQDMAQRSQEFDAAQAAGAEALGQIGALPTSDIEGRNQRLQAVEKAMDEAVARRGGDYRLAAKDLQRIIAQERANPWYQYNTEQQQAKQTYRKLAADANKLIVGSPNVSFDQYQQALEQGQDPFAFRALDKNQLYELASDQASKYANLLLTDPEFRLNSKLDGQYWEKVAQKGFDDQSINEFIESGEGAKIRNSILASYPELEGVNEDQAREIIKQGLRSAIGPTEAKELSNKNYMSDYQLARLAQQNKDNVTTGFEVLQKTGTGLVPSSISDLKSDFYKQKSEQLVKEQVKALGLPETVKTIEDLENLTKDKKSEEFDTMFKVGSDYYPTVKTNINKFKEPAEKALENIQTRLESGDIAFPRFAINTLMNASNRSLNELEGIRDSFESEIKRNLSKFKPFSKDDRKTLEDVDKKSLVVTEITPSVNKGNRAGLVVYMQGENDKGELENINMYIDPSETLLEEKLMGFLGQMNSTVKANYLYNRYGDEYLSELEKALPTMSPAARENAQYFIQSKRQ